MAIVRGSVSRRQVVLLGAAAPLLFACKGNAPPESGAKDAHARAAPDGPAGVCAATEANIEGPYYRAGAPERSELAAGLPGVPLEIEGRVTTIDCKTTLADVELDVWQANHSGHYDNDGSMPPGSVLLRGRLKTDGEGRYRVKTIVPGRYLNGPQYRPAHVHVKLRARGHASLTTQLYFPDDPFNDVDPFIHRSLVMDVKRNDRVLLARYDFVLKPA
jgi:protocatechuate 3,4-dioxygenase beta subunit